MPDRLGFWSAGSQDTEEYVNKKVNAGGVQQYWIGGQRRRSRRKIVSTPPRYQGNHTYFTHIQIFRCK